MCYKHLPYYYNQCDSESALHAVLERSCHPHALSPAPRPTNSKGLFQRSRPLPTLRNLSILSNGKLLLRDGPRSTVNFGSWRPNCVRGGHHGITAQTSRPNVQDAWTFFTTRSPEPSPQRFFGFGHEDWNTPFRSLNPQPKPFACSPISLFLPS